MRKRCKYVKNRGGKFRKTKTCRYIFRRRRVSRRTRRHSKGYALRKYRSMYKWTWGRQIKKRGSRYFRKRLLIRTWKGKRTVRKSYFRKCRSQKRCAKIFARRHKPRKGAAGRRLCYKVCRRRRKGKRICYSACKKRIFKVLVKTKGVNKVCTKSCTSTTVKILKKGKKGSKGKPVIKVSKKCVVRCTGLVKKALAKKVSKKTAGKKTAGKKTAAKKTAGKKTVVKKTAAKKPVAKKR